VRRARSRLRVVGWCVFWLALACVIVQGFRIAAELAAIIDRL
jgi:hypothetical protein